MKSSNLALTAFMAFVGAVLVGMSNGATEPGRSKQAVERDAGAGGSVTTSDLLVSLGKADDWLNSPPLAPMAFHGKVVAVNFWTYTCVNWLRTAPYMRAWAAKFREQGLIVVGVHSPEFEFEKDPDNVRWALKEMNVVYPVAVDNKLAIWSAFENEYWPTLYIFDANGRLRYRHFGEGQYAESEKIIQDLLIEAGATTIDHAPAAVNAHGVELAADWSNLQSDENYVGAARTKNFASAGGMIANKIQTYTRPQKLELNEWALAGDWQTDTSAATSTAPNAAITYRYHARDLNLVMGQPAPERHVRFRVTIDGNPPKDLHGSDVDEDGYGIVSRQRLYQLVRDPGVVRDRSFEIEFFDLGVSAFAFTFG